MANILNRTIPRRWVRRLLGLFLVLFAIFGRTFKNIYAKGLPCYQNRIRKLRYCKFIRF